MSKPIRIKSLRASSHILLAAAALVQLPSAEASTVWQSWLGVTGSWSNASLWDASPDGTGPWDYTYETTFPNNTATITHDAVLGAGTATLDGDYTINHLGVYQTATVNGAGSLTINQSFLWQAGYLHGTGAAVNLAAGATLTMAAQPDGTHGSRLLSRVLNNYGTANYTGGYFNFTNGGVLNNHGVFNASSPNNIFRSSGAGTINNYGTFTKTGTNDFRIGTTFYNTGQLNISEGKLRFEAPLGNNAAGVIDVTTGATLSIEDNFTGAAGSLLGGPGTVSFNAGVSTFAPGTFLPTGVVNFTLGTVTINNTITPSALGTIAATLNVNADQSWDEVSLTGQLNGTGAVSINKLLTWSKGLMQGTGVTMLGPTSKGHIVAESGNSATIYTRTVNNYGSLTHSLGTFGMNMGATLNNYGSFLATSDTGIGRTSGSSTFNNAGTFTKQGTGSYGIRPIFNNTGTVTVQQGSLVLEYQSSNAGTITVDAGATLEFGDNGTHAAGSVVNGAGNLLLSSGTHDFGSATVATTGTFRVGGSANVTIGNTLTPSGVVEIGVGGYSPNVTFDAPQTFADVDLNGSIHGTGDVTITNSFAWGGAMSGTGKAVIAAGATATFKDAGKAMSRVVENRGTFNYAVGTLYINGTGTLENYGVINASSPNGLARSSGTGGFNNHGTFNKGGTSNFQSLNPFNNHAGGVVNVDAGTLQLNNGGTNSGTINVAAGATLHLSSAYAYAEGSSVSGAGNVTFMSGVHVLPAGSFNATGVLTAASGATVMINNAVSPSALGPVAGTLNLNANQTFADVTLSGTLGGSGNVDVTGALNWTGGTMGGTGATTVAPGATLTVSDSAHTLSRVLENYGAATHTGGNFAINGGTFNNHGVFTSANTTSISRSSSGTSVFNNYGTFDKEGASTLGVSIAIQNAAGGQVNVKDGTLELTAAGSGNAGTISVAAGTTLKLATGLTHAAGSVISGAGNVWVSAGTHDFPAGAYASTGVLKVDGSSVVVTFNSPIAPSSVAPLPNTIHFNADQTLDSLTLLPNGNIGGAGNLTLTGGLVWTGGNLVAGGKVILPAGATLDLSGGNARTLNRVLETSGVVNYTGGSINASNGTIVNKGTFNTSGPNGVSRTSGSAALVNEGTFNKTGTTSFVTGSGVAFNNAGAGITNVNAGSLELGGGGTNAGVIVVAPSAVLKLAGSYEYAAGSTIEGDGTVEFAAGTHVLPAGTFNPAGVVKFVGTSTVTVNNAIQPSAIEPVTASAVNFNADQTFDSLTLVTNSTVGGTGNLTVDGKFYWNGGTVGGTGRLTMPPGSTLEMSAGNTRAIGRNIDLHGTANVAGGMNNFSGTGLVLNNFGTLNMAGGLGRNSGSHTVNNEGTINSSGTDALVMSQIVVNNAGTLNVTAGKLTLGSSPTQHVGAALTGGTWNVSDGATLVLTSGSNITSNAGSITLNGPTSKFDKINGLNANSGVLALGDGRSFTTAGAFDNAAYLILNGSHFGATGALTNSAQLVLNAGSTLTANAAVTNTGNVTVGDGSVFTVKNGFTQTGGTLSGEGTLAHTGGTSTIGASQRWSDGARLSVTGGTLTLASDAGGFFSNPTLAVEVSTAGTLKSSSVQRLKSVAVDGGGRFELLAGGGVTLVTRSLSLAGTGQLDLNDNRLAVTYDPASLAGSPAESIRQYLLNDQIVSSAADADPLHLTGVAYAEAASLDVTTWGGMIIPTSSVVACVTWIGDANMDATLDADDYSIIDRGLARNLTGWRNGDFDYSGTVDQGDYLLIDRTFVQQQQGGTPAPEFLAAREAQFGEAYVSQLIAAVPEPGHLALLGAAVPVLGRRRRRVV